jgi:hypothetical protein
MRRGITFRTALVENKMLISEIKEKLCEHVSEKQKLGCVVSIGIDDFLARNGFCIN